MSLSQAEKIQDPAYWCRKVLKYGFIFGENNLKSVIYRHKIFMIKEQFRVALAPSNQGSETSFHLKLKGA